MTRCNNRDVAYKNEKKDYNNFCQRRYIELLIFKLVFVMSGVLMLLCVWQQDDSSAEHDDEGASERVSLLLYVHFVSFIDCIF